jgi:hypothetical protein
MSNNRKFAVLLVAVWVVIIIGLTSWAMNDTFSIFYAEALAKGLSTMPAVFYALKLSGAAANWIQVPLIFGNLPVAFAFRYLWRLNAKGKAGA